MKKIYLILISVLALGVSQKMNAQVGFNNANPDPSAVIDVKATDKGILIPRMTTGERNSMAIGTPTPAHGLLVFDTGLNRIYYWNGSAWKAVNVVAADSTGANEVTRLGNRSTIGSGYMNAQPDANGMLIQGNTAIGTTNPAGNKFRVAGTTELDGNTSVTGTLSVDGTTALKTTNITGNTRLVGTMDADNYAHTGTGSNGPVPSGGIIMWSGSTASIPSGWALCDGTNGTPNLQDKFVVGAGSTYSVNGTGGSTTHSHTTGSAGSHTHRILGDTEGITTGNPSGTYGYPYYANDDNAGWTSQAYLETHTGNTQEGQHAHSMDFNSQSNGAHTHTVSSANHLPPYFALAYIMKL